MDYSSNQKSLHLCSNYMANFYNILEPGKVPCMTKEWRPKNAYNLHHYLTPEDLKKRVLKSSRLKILIEHYAEKNNLKKKDLEKCAKRLLDEIGLERSMPVIRWMGICINIVAKKICSGIYINELNLDHVKQHLGNKPVLYLPSHRSYCDFILMSYICFHYNMEIPGIAAGIDFISMTGMGTLLRKTGAFFMRRSFNEDEIYWDVFQEYVCNLVTSYHTGLEFFIEGTRSRNFKALTPKIGLLSMALYPFFTGQVDDILIVPVSVSYERLLEENLFAYELLGSPKPKETTKGFFKALKIIEERFGRMYMDFGEPISVKDYFGGKINRMNRGIISTEFQKLQKNEIGLVKDLAYEVVHQQQSRIVITTFNLIALYFSYKSLHNQQINIEQLCNGVALLKNTFNELNAPIATDEKTLKNDIIETLKIHSNILTIATNNSQIKLALCNGKKENINIKKMKGYQFDQNTINIAIPIITLQIYINPCMFWFVKPSIICLCALRLYEEYNNEIHKNQLRLDSEELYSVFCYEFIFQSQEFFEDFNTCLNFLIQLNVLEYKNGLRFKRNELCDIFLATITPFLFCYFQVLETIAIKLIKGSFTEKELFIANQQRVEELILVQAQHIHAFCLSLDNIKNVLMSLVNLSIVEKQKGNNIYYSCHKDKLIHLRSIILKYCHALSTTFETNCNTLLAKL